MLIKPVIIFFTAGIILWVDKEVIDACGDLQGFGV